jgi:hypothetical protein
MLCEAALASTFHEDIYFGHWLSEDFSFCLAPDSLATSVITVRPAYRHKKGYC